MPITTVIVVAMTRKIMELMVLTGLRMVGYLEVKALVSVLQLKMVPSK